MKIVIDIPEETWERVKDGYVPLGISKYLKNGTPLPKGHGRLIDAYDMKDIEFINKGDYNSTRTIREWIDSAPTIIESDDES